VWKAGRPDLPEVNHARNSLLQAIQIAEAAKVAELEAEQVAADAAIEGAEAAAMEVRALLDPEIADSVVLSSRQALSNDLAAARAALADPTSRCAPAAPTPRWSSHLRRPAVASPSPASSRMRPAPCPLGDLAPGIIALTAPLRLVSEAQSLYLLMTPMMPLHFVHAGWPPLHSAGMLRSLFAFCVVEEPPEGPTLEAAAAAAAAASPFLTLADASWSGCGGRPVPSGRCAGSGGLSADPWEWAALLSAAAPLRTTPAAGPETKAASTASLASRRRKRRVDSRTLPREDPALHALRRRCRASCSRLLRTTCLSLSVPRRQSMGSALPAAGELVSVAASLEAAGRPSLAPTVTGS